MKNSVQEKLKVVRKILSDDQQGEPEYVVDQKVQDFMEENDLTIEEMAALAGVSKTVVRNTGQEVHQNMHITNAYKLMRAMGEDDLVDFAFEFDSDEEEERTEVGTTVTYEEEEEEEEEKENGKFARQARAEELTVAVPGDTDDLTQIEAEVLAYFRQLKEDTGASPTISELSTAMGYEQPNGVYEQIQSLHEKGYLHKNDNTYQRVYQLSPKAATLWNADWDAIRGY